MVEEKLYYFSIGIVSSDIKAKNFVDKESRDLLEARDKVRKDHLPVRLGLKTTILRGKLSDENANAVYSKLTELMNEDVDVFVDMFGSGPTRTMYGVLFDRGITSCVDYSGKSGFRAVATGDLDQFPPQKNLENMLDLWDLTKSSDAILGVGSRSVPVVLSANKENSYLRRIFEGFVNLSVKNVAEKSGNKIITPEDYGNSKDQAYSETGDFVTGIYLANANHRRSMEFANVLTSLARANNFWGFEDEYLMGIASANLGNLAARNFYSLPNLFDPQDVAKEKGDIIERQIQTPLKKLSRTGVAPFLRKIIESPVREILERHYTSDQIKEVSGYMLDALKA
jgi:hypothetical protein